MSKISFSSDCKKVSDLFKLADKKKQKGKEVL
jgi:hypothetical protein